MATENNDLLMHMQQFTASTISILELLQKSCQSVNKPMTEREVSMHNKLLAASQKFIDNLKSKDDELDSDYFDFPKFIKKVFYTLRTENALKLLKTKDTGLFEMRDEDKKIITMIPGVDIRFALQYMPPENLNLFWQYFHLFATANFKIIRATNVKKFDKFVAVKDAIDVLENELKSAKFATDDKIFNPFVGVAGNSGEYTVDKLFDAAALANQTDDTSQLSSMLTTMGVEKILDPEKLKEQLKELGDEHVTEATDKIIDMLGAQNNSDIKEVCTTLIKDIVDNLKTKGLTDITGTLMSVAQNARSTIDIEKMKKTAAGMQNFMHSNAEKLMNSTDENGNKQEGPMIDMLTKCMGSLNMGNSEHQSGMQFPPFGGDMLKMLFPQNGGNENNNKE